MKSKKSIYERIDDFLQKSKVPTAYILFIYIASVEYIPNSWVSEDFKEASLWSTAIALGLIILGIFFEIYKKINEPKKSLPFFRKWNDVINSGEFLDLFKKRLHDDKIIYIKIIGISLRFHWPYIKNLMEEYIIQDKNVEFNVTIAMLNTEAYDDLQFIDKKFKDKFLMHSKATKNDINFFKSVYESKNNSCKCNIELLEYNFMPPFYGISLDDKFLFLGNTYWNKDGIFRGAGQSYNIFTEDDHFSGSEKIKIFNSWIEYVRNQHKKIK